MSLLRLLVPLLPSVLSLLPMQQQAARRLVLQIVLGTAAGILVAAAVGFALAALYMALEESLGAAPGAAVEALILLLIAGALVTPLVIGGERRARAAPQRPLADEAAAAASLLAGQVERHPLASVAAMALVGAVLGELLRRR